MKKAQEIPGFVSICRLLAEGGFPLRMAEAGLENVSEIRGKVAVADQLSKELSIFDLGSLWEALGDLDRATLFVVAAGMIEEQAVGR